MTAAVFSDTHGNTALMLEAVRRLRPDIIIHLGDCERDTACLRTEFPEIPLYSVCGNCDLGSTLNTCDTVPMGPVKAFITHGHLFDVKWREPDSIVYAAQQEGAKIAMFGHTHIPMNTEVGGVKLINPGTAGRGGRLRGDTFAVVEVFDNGGIASEIRQL